MIRENRRRRRSPGLLWLAGLLWLTGLLWLSPDANADTDGIRFDRLSIEDGLSQNTVVAILQDNVGFMWFGTQEGLNRYDGHNFIPYKHDEADPNSLPDNSIRALIDTPSGDIWVGTDGGLARWHRATDTFTTYRHDPTDPGSLGSDLVRALLVDKVGALWIGTDSGLDRLGPAAGGSFEHFRHQSLVPAGLSDDRVRALHEDREGDIWVGTMSGLCLFDRISGTFKRFHHGAGTTSLSDDQVRSILEDSNGDLWIGTYGGGLNRLDRATLSFTSYRHDPTDPRSLSGDRIRVIWKDRQKRLWIGTNQGLNLFHRESGSFVRHQHRPTDPYSLSQDRVMAIYQDRADVIWVGTHYGLNRSNPRTWAFRHYKSPFDLSDNDIMAFSEDRGGGLWVATLSGLNEVDRASGTYRVHLNDPSDPKSLSDNQTTALLHDRDDVLWVGTMSGGLHRRSDVGGGFERFQHDPGRPESLASNAIVTLFESGNGDLWIGTFGGGLDRLERSQFDHSDSDHSDSDHSDSRFEHFRFDPDNPRSLSQNKATSIAEDHFGGLWVGTEQGLSRLDSERREFDRFHHDAGRPESLSHNDVSVLFFDHSRCILWIGTEGGLNRLDHPESSKEASFHRYSGRHGLPGSVINGILDGGAGKLWISTNNGLARFDPETETFENFDTSDGLRSNDFTLRAAYASRGNELFFGTFSGFNAFFPDQIETNSQVPPVVLTAFSKMNEPVRFDRPIFDVDTIPLSYRDNFFSFEVASLDFTAPRKNQYRYQLEGFNEGWISIGSRREITFTNLDPGPYTLRVRGSNNDDVWNEEGLSVSLYIEPPFWQTWYFKGAMILALLLAIFIGYEIKVRQIRRNSERLQTLVDERTGELREAQDRLVRKERLAVLGELAGSVAHELRNPLGAIKNSILYLQLTQKSITEKGGEHLTRMDKDIVRSNAIITELLDYARAPKLERRPLPLQEITESAVADLEVPEDIVVKRHFAPQPLTVEIDPRHVHQILTNLLTNALQAMPEGGNLQVECLRRDDEAVVAVIDSGDGISAEDESKIFEPLFTKKTYGIGLGLALSQRYAQLHNGRLDFRSEPGHGATFELSLPLRAPAGSLSG